MTKCPVINVYYLHINGIFGKTFRNMKQILAFCALLVCLVSCQKNDLLPTQIDNNLANVNINKQNNVRLGSIQKVKLLKCWSSSAYVYHGMESRKRNFYVEVANIDFNKKVSIWHKMSDGTWKDLPLQFLASSVPGEEIWFLSYDYSTMSANPALSNEFVVKYTVKNQTYWDNNNGKNYKIAAADGMFLRSDLNVSVDVHASYFSYYPNSNPLTANFGIVADLRNIAYSKEAWVIYTTDGWKTNKQFKLNFQKYYVIGNGVSLVNPNQFGIERWAAYIPINPTIKKLEYAVVYKVNGKEFWDNNYGRNYILNQTRY